MPSQAEKFIGNAPGRLDVMGGIADYSGSLVLQMPIREKTVVEFTPREDFLCRITSHTSDSERHDISLDYRSLLKDGKANIVFAQQKLRENKDGAWAAYIIGCALMLHHYKGIEFKGGDFRVHSDVPLGKGVSSSASLEVATMNALAQAFNITFTGTELPVLAQRVENQVVGAPCGLMDQLATFFGKPGKLLPIVCQPDLVREPVSIPDNVAFIGIDSGVRHSVGGASYGDVRCAAFMGYSIIAQSLGASLHTFQQAKDRNDFSALPYRGYLCNITVNEFESRFLNLLPQKIKGKDFIREFTLTTDAATQVDPEVEYAVRQCTAHPVYENERVHNFLELLRTFNSVAAAERESSLNSLGHLMRQSHESYSQCGLGSSRTDEIVSLSKDRDGIYGAKITGGGSGGTVCLLTWGEAGKKSVMDLHEQLCKKYNTRLALFK
jgi:L-arabinokinase